MKQRVESAERGGEYGGQMERGGGRCVKGTYGWRRGDGVGGEGYQPADRAPIYLV
jgi:hypothetical protein